MILRNLIMLTLLLLSNLALAGQWRTAVMHNPLEAWRLEDVYFTTASQGWAVAMNGQVLHTQDAGESWREKTRLTGALRSVDFLNPQVGIIGSISNAPLFRTQDGGQTWQAITMGGDFFQGVCGISHAENSFFAAGRFAEGSWFYKSTDQGLTWVRKDLSALAHSLVDVMFLNTQVGFITGKGAQPGQGAVILKTEDGGNNWRVLHATGNNMDHHVWKLEKIDDQMMVGSIWASDSKSPAFMIRSMDAGKTWTRHMVSPEYFYVEGIGFYDRKLGWMGGGDGMWETRDSGLTWKQIAVNSQVNRFFRLGKKLLAVGKEITIYEE